MSVQNEYETDNLNIATFLFVRGVKFIECRIVDDNSFKCVFVFQNIKNQIAKLEEEWLQSNEKKFKDALSHFRSLIEKNRKRSYSYNRNY